MWSIVIAGLSFVPLLQHPRVCTLGAARASHLFAQEAEESPVKALADAMTQAEAVTDELAEASAELDSLEAATAEELGLSPEELETFMDGEDGESKPATTSPVEALADVMVAQEEASAALQEGFEEFEEIEKEIATELGVTVDELECVEDSDLELDALLPEGCEWGGTY